MLRAVLIVAALAFLGVLLNALLTAPTGPALQFLTEDPWGITTLTDLYLGLLVFIVIVYRFERSVTRTAAWAIPTLLLGNIVPALYCVLVLTRIAPLSPAGEHRAP